ncbi:CynX/NimT family MFS transporter [Chitinimonas koreensis]|uniref:CynX/NimT family MFS transporter n=1 Tax=Chitinimonas koreensis TaxID=356302 RepID=UPI0003F50E33|nr:MFS transporter [Chitinimonas koreensis]QNM94788.1 MFS transporter [Chitinimonas koreensis]
MSAETRSNRRAAVVLLLGMVLVGLNLRPALSSIAPVLRVVRDGMGLSATAAGLLTTLPVLCLGLFAPLAPVLARRLGGERTVLLALAILMAGLLLRPFAGVAGLFLGTVMAGAAIGIGNVILPAIVKREFAHKVGPVTGLYTMALSLGAALAAGFTVPVQQLAGGDWRWGLAFWALPALLAAAAWWPQLRQHRALGAARPRVRGLWRDPLAWQVMIYMGAQSSLSYCVFGWLPTILADRGMSALAAGFMMSLSVLVQLVTALTGPWFATRGRDQRAAIAVVLALTLAGLLGCVYAPIEQVWLWAAILGLGQGGTFSIALTLIVLRAHDAHVAGELSGMAQGGGYTLAALGPLLVGLLHEWTHGWHAVAAWFGALTLLALAAGLGAGRNRYVLWEQVKREK